MFKTTSLTSPFPSSQNIKSHIWSNELRDGCTFAGQYLLKKNQSYVHCINHSESISWLWNPAFSIHWWIIILDPLGGIYTSGQLKTKLSLTDIWRWRKRDVHTDDQEAEEYGQPAGLLFLLGLDPCLHWKNWLGCWGCRRRWLDSCCCGLKGLIAVAIRVIGLAARTQS